MPGIDINGVHFRVFGDSFWLIRDVFMTTGVSLEQATRRALEVFLPLGGNYGPDITAAVNSNISGYLAISPRYTAIFESRPLASLILAPFLLTFGSSAIGWVIAVELALAAIVMVFFTAQLTKRRVGSSPLLAAITLVCFFALPPGEWGSAYLYEGLSYFFVGLIALLALFVLQRTPRAHLAALILLPVSFLGLAAKSSGTTPFLIVLAVAFGWLILRTRGKDRAPLIALGSVLLASAVWAGIGALNKWPGVMDSLQDTFTNHFALPDVPNPIELWKNLLISSTKGEIHWALDNPAIPLALLALVIFVVLRFGMTSVLVVGFVLAGVANYFIHPEPSEFERFIAVAWLAAVVAVPVLITENLSFLHVRNQPGYVRWMGPVPSPKA
jgi:hypothetical protein